MSTPPSVRTYRPRGTLTPGAAGSLYLMLMLRSMPVDESWTFFRAARPDSPKTFQNLSVSSAAAETTVAPSGLWAMWSTRAVCPVSSAILVIVGYFHRQSWFWLKPWLLRISRSFLFHTREHTWELVSMEFTHAPVCVFQNLMHRSAVPPPDASRLLWNGHHASALTAALCSSSRCRYLPPLMLWLSQT